MDVVQLKMQQELANTQEVALKLEAQNKGAMRDMQRMRADFKSQEQERERLVAQNLVVKRENKALQATVLALRERFEAMFAEEEGDGSAKVKAIFVFRVLMPEVGKGPLVLGTCRNLDCLTRQGAASPVTARFTGPLTRSDVDSELA